MPGGHLAKSFGNAKTLTAVLGYNRHAEQAVAQPCNAAFTLIAWALYRWCFSHRHRVRFGMQVGLAGLFVWSFLMAAAHGAGLMLWPALMPLCSPSGAGAVAASAPLAAGLVGVGVHTLAMLSVTAAIAATVYEWVGLEVLRRAWLNIDALWVTALLATGMLMLENPF